MVNETFQKNVCAHCRGEVIEDATRCPHCYRKIKQWFKTRLGIIITILLFPIVVPYLVWKETKWNKGIKIAITVACLIIVGMSLENSHPYLETEGLENVVQETKSQIIETDASEDIAKESTQKNQEEDRVKQIEEQFSIWDGSHRGLTKVIKNSMNNPESYEHVETRHWIMDDHIIVSTTFRGTNAFGGTITNTVKSKISLDGEVIEILEQI